MSQQELEQRLRAHLRATVAEAELVPGDLWDSVLSIPDVMPHRRGVVQGRGFVVLVAAALLATLLIGGAIAIGAGVLRLPWLSDRDAPTIAGFFEDMPVGDDLVPGTYALRYETIGGGDASPGASPSLDMTFTVPNEWKRVRVDGLLWNDGRASILFAVVKNLYADVCDRGAGQREPPVGPSVDHLVTALIATPGWQDAVVSDVTLSGFSGRHLELTGGDDTSCAVAEARLFRTLGSPGYALAPGPDEHYEVWILDVRGTRLVILAGSELGATARVRDELDAIIDSLVITP